MKTIKLQNNAQVLLWNTELSGQVSDGYWENARPFDHYKAVSGAKAVIGDELSINFYLRRKYNFAAAQLLEYVGARMRMNVLVQLTYPILSYEAIRCFDNGSYMWASDSYKKTLKELSLVGINNYDELQAAIKNLDATLYTMKDLKKDLKAITTAFNTFNPK
jgi:hypothetical protein